MFWSGRLGTDSGWHHEANRATNRAERQYLCPMRAVKFAVKRSRDRRVMGDAASQAFERIRSGESHNEAREQDWETIYHAVWLVLVNCR